MIGGKKNIWLLLLFFSTVFAHAGNFVDNQLWSEHYLYKPVNENARFISRLGSRIYSPESSNNYLIHYRQSYHFKVKQFEPQIGMAFFYQDVRNASKNIELRPWIGFNFNKTLTAPLKFINLAKLEYRLFNNAAFSDRFTDASRLMYEFGLIGNLIKLENSIKIYGIATVLSFWDLAHFDHFDYDLLRFNTGVGLALNPSISLEVIYSRNIEQAGSLNLKGDYSNLLQLKLRHRLFK